MDAEVFVEYLEHRPWCLDASIVPIDDRRTPYRPANRPVTEPSLRYRSLDNTLLASYPRQYYQGKVR